MTEDTITSLRFVFSSLWNLIGSFTFPGTNLTGQHLLVAPLGAIVFITVFRKILDIGAADINPSVHFYGWSDANYRKWKREERNKGQED